MLTCGMLSVVDDWGAVCYFADVRQLLQMLVGRRTEVCKVSSSGRVAEGKHWETWLLVVFYNQVNMFWTLKKPSNVRTSDRRQSVATKPELMPDSWHKGTQTFWKKEKRKTNVYCDIRILTHACRLLQTVHVPYTLWLLHLSLFTDLPDLT